MCLPHAFSLRAGNHQTFTGMGAELPSQKEVQNDLLSLSEYAQNGYFQMSKELQPLTCKYKKGGMVEPLFLIILTNR